MINKLRFHFNALYNRIIWKLKKKPIVKSIDETLDYIRNMDKDVDIAIIEKRLSLSRYGDGEFTLIDVEYEWFIHGATDKIALNGKFVNEVPEGREVAEINDPVYESQIIESIF